eukprot:6690738-Pyramimonas_sp.AAC.1
MHSAIQSHWSKVFAAKPVDTPAMQQCLDMVFTPAPPRHLPLPGIGELQAAAKLASDSAPGPDGLPYRA